MIRHLLLALAALFFAAPALAVETACCRERHDSWYFGLAAQGVFLKDYDITSAYAPTGASAKTASLDFGAGFGVTGNLGYRVLPALRAELEVSHYVTDSYDAVGVSSTPIPAGYKRAGQRDTALMANLYYDWRNSSYFTPYIGAGGGIMRLRSPLVGTLSSGGTVVETKKLQDWAGAYQLMAGVSHELHDGVFGRPSEIVLGYRYVQSGEGSVNFGSVPGFSDSGFRHASHNVELGWRLYF